MEEGVWGTHKGLFKPNEEGCEGVLPLKTLLPILCREQGLGQEEFRVSPDGATEEDRVL